MNFSEHFNHLRETDEGIVKDHKSTGWIQWKGTDVCIDIHCKCGHHGHFDGYFMYYFKCPKCDTLYHPQTTIAMIPVEGEHEEFVVKDRPNVIQTCELEDEEK